MRKRAGGPRAIKTGQIGAAYLPNRSGGLRADPVPPVPRPAPASALIGRIMTSNSIISPDLLNL